MSLPQADSRMRFCDAEARLANDRAYFSRRNRCQSASNFWTPGVKIGVFSIRPDCGQALSGPRYLWLFLSLAGPLFSSGSALRLSQHGIRGMGRLNLTRVLVARRCDRHKSQRELTPSIVPRGTSIRRAAELGSLSCSRDASVYSPAIELSSAGTFPSSSGIPFHRTTCGA